MARKRKRRVSKTRKLVRQAFKETKGERFPGGRKQRIAVSLNKARRRGAKIPKRRRRRR